ncbi:MAG: hypothetical protein ABI643_00225 [Candidatus Doudnabacteria bacterium]
MAEILRKPGAEVEAGNEFYEAAQTNQTEANTRGFSTAAEREELADKTKKILEYQKPAGAEKEPEAIFSDATQIFVDRFEAAKDQAEATKIMNEVIAAAQKKEIPPDEAIQLLGQVKEHPESLSA